MGLQRGRKSKSRWRLQMAEPLKAALGMLVFGDESYDRVMYLPRTLREVWLFLFFLFSLNKMVARVDAQLSLWAEDEDQTDIVWLTSSGFLEPTTLLRGEVSEVAITSKKMKSLKGVYNTDGLVVTQAQVCSRICISRPLCGRCVMYSHPHAPFTSRICLCVGQVQRRHNDSVLHGCPKIHGTEWSTANAAVSAHFLCIDASSRVHGANYLFVRR